MLATLYSLISETSSFVHLKGTEINTRCNFCGDSDNMQHGHMYIGEKENVLVYYCQRCNAKGLINNIFLDLYSVYDIGFKVKLRESLKHSSRTNYVLNSIEKSSRKFREYQIPDITEYDSDEKLAYLDRINFDGSYKQLKEYKIVLSLHQFLIENDIEYIFNDAGNYYKDIIDDLDENYIGFLIGENIIFRRINPGKKRYYNFEIKETDELQFYLIETEIDLSKPITIVMSEGIFDIINIKNKLYNDAENVLFVAVLNKDYINKIKFMLAMIGDVSNVQDIIIYSDADAVEKKFFFKQFSMYRFVSNLTKIYKNTVCKDFGDYDKNIVLKKINHR